jgi:hypothetical protein
MQAVHYSPYDISPTEDTLVCQQMEPLLTLVIDDAPPWRLLVFNFGGHCASALEPRPVVNMAGRMTQSIAVGFRQRERRRVYDDAVAKEPENADARFWSDGIVHGVAYLTFPH